MIGIMETRVNFVNCLKISRKLMRGWHCKTNYDQHLNGRIWLLWDPTVLDVQLLLSTSQVMYVVITVVQKQFSFHASYVYGLNTSQERKEL